MTKEPKTPPELDRIVDRVLADWNVYRMWRRAKTFISDCGNSSEMLGDWAPTELTFKGRSQCEAQKKADRFWRDAQLGTGSMVCVLEGERP